MAGRFRHYEHVVRLFVLFALGFSTFLVVRWALVPSDFGRYGFYRAGALDAVKARPVKFAGEAACVDCHTDVADLRKDARHRNIHCEACHGPLATHASGDFDTAPRALNPRTLCLQCHAKAPGKPDGFPQIVAADHAGDGPCTECHKPHRPKID